MFSCVCHCLMFLVNRCSADEANYEINTVFGNYPVLINVQGIRRPGNNKQLIGFLFKSLNFLLQNKKQQKKYLKSRQLGKCFVFFFTDVKSKIIFTETCLGSFPYEKTQKGNLPVAVKIIQIEVSNTREKLFYSSSQSSNHTFKFLN